MYGLKFSFVSIWRQYLWWFKGFGKKLCMGSSFTNTVKHIEKYSNPEKKSWLITITFSFLRMRLLFEYRIPMPLSVEEQRVGLRFMVMEGMYRYVLG